MGMGNSHGNNGGLMMWDRVNNALKLDWEGFETDRWVIEDVNAEWE